MSNIKLNGYVEFIQSDQQLLNYFPGSNTKLIDYVIVYKNDLSEEDFELKNEKRRLYFKKLADEGIEAEFFELKKDEQIYTVAMLHARFRRLLIEAERIKLQMPLNKKLVNDPVKKIRFTNKFFQKVLSFFRLVNATSLDFDDEQSLSAQFENSKRFLFGGFDSSKQNILPLTNTTRSLLVDHILRNITYIQKESTPQASDVENDADDDDDLNKLFKIKKIFESFNSYEKSVDGRMQFAGLEFMIEDKFFTDALILHDPSALSHNYGEYLLDEEELKRFNIKEKQVIVKKLVNIQQTDNFSDPRQELHLKWAQINNFFKFQTINLIKSYFGEAFALYFAWIEHFILCLLIPTIIGIIFFIIGISSSVQENENALKKNISISAVEYTFSRSFDNFLTPYYAFLICVWGIFFTETWEAKNYQFRYKWNLDSFEKDEPDLPEYTKRKYNQEEKLKSLNEDELIFYKLLYKYEQTLKKLASNFVLLILIGIVALEIMLVIIYKVYIKVKVFPQNSLARAFIGDVGSSVLNAIFVNIMNFIYKILSKRLTKWENYQTNSEYEDSLTLKLFIFKFINNYSSLFYLSFFRTTYSNGIFNLGSEYQDACNDSCMNQLSIQIFIQLLIVPVTNFFTNIALPLIKNSRKLLNQRKQMKELEKYFQGELNHANDQSEIINEEESLSKFNRKLVLVKIAADLKKPKTDKRLFREYCEKVILYGYILLFGCSFSLGPLMVILLVAFDLRLDALSLLWVYRRPVGYQAQDIGAFLNIIRFINVVGNLSNAFIIAFTSEFSKTVLQNKLEYKLLFVIIFENLVFLMWFFIRVSLKISESFEKNVAKKKEMVKKIFDAAQIYNPSDKYSSNYKRNLRSRLIKNNPSNLTNN